MMYRLPFAPRPARPALCLVGFLSTVAACSDSTAPKDRPDFDPAASVRWNAIARDLVIKYRTDPPLASRTYALLSIAQDRAVSAALTEAEAARVVAALNTAMVDAGIAVWDAGANGPRPSP